MNKGPLIPLVLVALAVTRPAAGATLVDDHQISINSEPDLSLLRRRLIQFIWGQDQLPDRLPTRISPAESPMANVENLKLEIDSVAPSHMISRYASTNLILHELNQNKRGTGAKL